jgi:HK97 family phage major capsid protein
MTQIAQFPEVRKGFVPASDSRADAPEKTGILAEDDLLADLLAEAKKAGEVGAYRIGRAIKSATANASQGGPGLPDGTERRIHDLLSRAASNRETVGFQVPMHALREQRAGALNQQTGAGSITSIIPPRTWYDALRSKLVLKDAGAQYFSFPGDRGGRVRIPVTTTPAQISWVLDGQSPPSQSNEVVGSRDFFPYTAAAFTDVSINMLAEGMPGFADMVIEHLMNGISVTVDAAGLNGTGTLGQPFGVLQVPFGNVVTPTSNTISFANLVQMIKQHGEVNGDSPRDAKLAFITSPAGRGTLMLTDKSATTSTGRYAWEAHEHCLPDGQRVTCESILGRSAFSSTSVPANLNASDLTTIVYGNFADLAINVWPSFSVLVNPFLFSTMGIVRISIFVDVDVQFLRPGSFIQCSGWTATF